MWAALHSPHAHANVRPLMQQALLALMEGGASGAVEGLLLPALCAYDTQSYQVGGR